MILRIRNQVKKFFAAVALLSIELIIVWILFILSLLVFILVADAIFLRKKDQFDLSVFQYLSAYVSPPLTSFMQMVTFLGTHTFLIPANLVLIFYFLVLKKHRWYSIKIPVVALGGVTLMFVLKMLFNRPRPLVPLLEPAKGLSFPSGHAMMSISFYGLLIYLVYRDVTNKLIKWILIVFLILLILVIGFSRIYLRVHYASDVIAGFSTGVIWLVVSVLTIRRIENYSRKEIDPQLTENVKAA